MGGSPLPKPTSKPKRLRPYLIALALIGTLAGGLFGGAYYESRQIRGCACMCMVKSGPIT